MIRQLPTTTNGFDDTFERFRRLANDPPDSATRRRLLKNLQRVVRENRASIREAVGADFGKTSTEADLTETATTLLEIRTALDGLGRWMSNRRVGAPFPFWTTRSFVVPQPKGVVLIISPWNYPVLLSLGPVVSAIAAGNRVVLKPSERTPCTSALLSRLLNEALGPEWCAVVEGDGSVGAELLELPFDHFYFTGSPPVGRIVMEAAARHLASVTLELGGKAPAIIDQGADVGYAADKVVIGKFMNAGQTCIAPDYVIAHDLVYDEVVKTLQDRAHAVAREHSEPMTGIVDSRHEERMTALWRDALARGATLADGSELDLSVVNIATGVQLGSDLMRHEIFGPILPVLRYSSLADIEGLVEQTGPPLTLYLFTRNESFADAVSSRISTGSICRDDVLLHFAHPKLPFGGTGSSGLGRTHGHSGFRAFSNEVSVLRSSRALSILSMVFPVKHGRQTRLTEMLLRIIQR